ncbi:MAG: protoporphyrinogen oxidase [Planctomycetota bacterium]
MDDRVDTIVVGAGMAGLAYAHARGPDADLLLLEASDRAGGLVETGRHELQDGHVHFEWGPEALQDNAPETRVLLRELGLDPLLAPDTAQRRYVVHRGRLVPLPSGPGSFLTSPLLSLGGKLRALSEPWRPKGRALDGSVADFARHRLGPQVLARLLDPFVTGVYAGDPELISLQAAFPMLHRMASEHGSLMAGMKARARERRAAREAAGGDADGSRGLPSLLSLRDGLGALPKALAAQLGRRLVLNCRVTAVHDEGKATGFPWRVEADHRIGPPGDTPAPVSYRCRRLVLAQPVRAVAGLLAPLEPELAGSLAAMAGESVVCLYHAWPRERVRHPLDGFGYLVPSEEGALHLGTLFSSSLNPGRCPEGQVLLRTLMGGAHHPEIVDWSDEQVHAELERGVAPLLGLSGAPVWSAIVRHREVLPRYDLDQPARQERVDAMLAERPGLSLLGNWRRGISVNALIEVSRKLARDHAR